MYIFTKKLLSFSQYSAYNNYDYPVYTTHKHMYAHTRAHRHTQMHKHAHRHTSIINTAKITHRGIFLYYLRTILWK